MKKAFFIGLFTLLSILSARAYDFEVDGIYYDITNSDTKEVEVSSSSPGNRYSGSVVIPATVTYEGTSYRVIAIGRRAFNNCSGLTSVTIPESVTSIGDYAFGGCIGLTSVTIPESVTSIGWEAFDACGRLTSLEWNARHCEDWNYDDVSFKSLTSITFGNNVEYIPAWLCYGCTGLASVTIPESVTSIGNFAFAGCRGLTSVIWNARHCADFYSDLCPLENTSLTSITFGSEVEYIPAYLCCGCRGLTTMTIPESVTSIGNRAFGGCSSLTSVEWNARHCADFDYGYLHPFSSNNWTSITFGNNVEHIPACLCISQRGLTSVTIPESVTSIGDFVFLGCSGLTSVTIPESVTSIGRKAFSECTSISGPLYNSKVFAYLPENYSGEYAIPFGIQSIAGGAFCGCDGLRSVILPESVNAIGAMAFYDCSGLVSVTVPNGIIYIGEEAFANCHALTSISLPESLEIISPYAFSGCGSLVSVSSLAMTPPRIGYYWGEDYVPSTESVFYIYSGTLYVPRGCKAAYDTAQEWYKFAKIEETSGVGTATVKVQVNDSTMGSVIGGGEWDYALDEQVTLVAVPYPGYYFVKWNDGKTSNPRILTVEGDITLTAIFANPGGTTANEETLAAAPFAYVQGRTAYLSDGLGEVEAFTATGQRVYRGFDRSIALPQPGVYILRVVADGRRCKVIVK